METFTRIPLFKADECHEVCRQIDALREHWIQRDPELPYFTLGAASYLDADPDPYRYANKAVKYNPILAESFGWLYDKVLAALVTHYSDVFEYAAEAARPGFHIFSFHEQFKQPMASVHFDRQYEDVLWQTGPDQDVVNAFSFTLPFCLPRDGGGLNVWDLTWDDFQTSLFLFPEGFARANPPTYVAYTEGVLMIHSGDYLHQIAPAPTMHPEDRRITMQGHAVQRGGTFHLYW